MSFAANIAGMRLSSGHMIGQYEVVELIGKGGIGEVRDTRLGCDVAIRPC